MFCRVTANLFSSMISTMSPFYPSLSLLFREREREREGREGVYKGRVLIGQIRPIGNIAGNARFFVAILSEYPSNSRESLGALWGPDRPLDNLAARSYVLHVSRWIDDTYLPPFRAPACPDAAATLEEYQAQLDAWEECLEGGGLWDPEQYEYQKAETCRRTPGRCFCGYHLGSEFMDASE